jgi:purine-binding chemotaxis protein CheW
MTEEAATTERQLVVFDLADEHYGVDISNVQEIIQMQTITRIPGSISSVEGLINLRGVVIPVVDLRKRFGMESAEHDKDTRTMVIHCHGEDIGMIVDSVTEVLHITSDSIEPPSSLITCADSNYILGVVKLPERLVILLDTDGVLSRQDQSAILSVASKEATNNEPATQESKLPETTEAASEEAPAGPENKKVQASKAKKGNGIGSATAQEAGREKLLSRA